MNQLRPFVFWDEQLSTLAVSHTLLDAGASRARHAAVVDKMAAEILQNALERLARRVPEDRVVRSSGQDASGHRRDTEPKQLRATAQRPRPEGAEISGKLSSSSKHAGAEQDGALFHKKLSPP